MMREEAMQIRGMLLLPLLLLPWPAWSIDLSRRAIASAMRGVSEAAVALSIC
jgi:hypothetical protein